MTPTEARQVVHNLTHRSHHHELDADDQILWTNALARFDLDAAMIAVTNLGAEPGFPKLERLIVECQNVTRQLANPTTEPGTDPRADEREYRNRVGLAGVRRARAALAAHPLPFPGWNAETEPVAS